MGTRIKRIRYFSSVRWSRSHYEAIKYMEASYQAIMLELIAIGPDDTKFNKKGYIMLANFMQL